MANANSPGSDPPSAADNLLLEDPMVTESGSPAELTVVVDALLDSLTNKFSSVSSEIFSKMDDMARRLDNLEELVQGADAKK